MIAPLWVAWLQIRSPRRDPRPGPAMQGNGLPIQKACPHCTNTDTLTLHCPDDRCGWVTCTCGAVVYSRRRHRHPLHRSDVDTCHDPKAAV